MAESKLRVQSMSFAVSIIDLVKQLKAQKESIISNQFGRSGTSIARTSMKRSMRTANRILLPSCRLR